MSRFDPRYTRYTRYTSHQSLVKTKNKNLTAKKFIDTATKVSSFKFRVSC